MTTPAKTIISTAPFLHDTATTPRIMWETVLCLVPVLLAGVYYFGLSVILITLVCIIACVGTEWLFGGNSRSVLDGSALITGVLLAFTLPPGFPLWMAFIGGIVAIGMGKLIWGGLGQNVFNPALVGRAFLQAAFPTAITTWEVPDGRYFEARGSNWAVPFFKEENIDAISAATPLAKMKFEQQATPWWDLFIGNTGGCIGETSAVILIILGIYLILRRLINWRIPVAMVLSTALLSSIFYLNDPLAYPSPHFMILAGGFLLGAVFMATDLVSSPLTPKGLWIYGTGIGILIVVIRLWGGLPEGVMYAILVMNAATPLINKFTKTRVYGHS